jgi:hypothetical protein
MSQFPINTPDGLYEAVNYLASGPQGLGQNFSGFSAYEDGYLTGNFRAPYSQLTPANLYVPGISLSNAQQLDDRTIKYTFSSTQSTPPFALGNGLTVTGITPSTYNSSSLRDAGSSINQIGVIECTTTYVIVRTVAPIATPLGTYVSGGSINFIVAQNYIDSGYNSTDCNARVTVTGGTDRVFISAQMTQNISYNVISGPSDFRVWVAVNRYVGSANNDPVNPDYHFELDTTVSRKIYTYTGLSGTGTLPELETVFTSILDQPPPGYYWYILEIVLEYPDTGGVEVEVTNDKLGLRSLSAQVVKQ